MTARRPYLPLILFLGFSVLAGSMRWPAVTEGLWEDEATSVFIAQAPTVREFLHRQAAIDYSPPLFNGLLAGWGRAFGFGEESVKSLGIIVGSLACGAIALAAAEIFGSAAGVFAGAFALVHRLLADMTAEARPYSLSALLVALCFWSLFRFIRRRKEGVGTKRSLALFGILALLAAESHYAGTAVVIVIGLYALLVSIRKESRAIWMPVAGATILVGIVLLPWVPIAWRQMHVGLPWAMRSRTTSVWGIALFKALALLPGSVDEHGGLPALGLALAAAAAVASFRVFLEEMKKAMPAIVLLAGAGIFAFFAVGLAGQVTRYVTVPAALAMILFGGLLRIVLCAARRQGKVETVAAAAAVTILLFCSARMGIRDAKGSLSRWRAGSSRSFVRVLSREGRFQPRDLVIAAPDMLGPTLAYYAPTGVILRGFVHWNNPAFADFSDYREKWPNPRIVDQTVDALEQDVSTHQVKRIVLVYAVGNDNPLPFRTRTQELRDAISKRFPLVSSKILGRDERIQIDVWRAR